ncbi:MAG: hypothetical protein AB1540_02085 [Bdellovibrionota bacterium]
MPGCHKCNQELRLETDFGRQDTCPGCGRATRCCLNCLHYDPSRYNECSEPVADRVVDKEKSTFCDYFKPSNKQKTGGLSAKEQALKAAEALFKKGK